MAVYCRRSVSLSLFSLPVRSSLLLLCSIVLFNPHESFADSPLINPYNVLSLCETQCVVAISNNDLESSGQPTSPGLFSYADVAFRDEPAVMVGLFDSKQFVWPSGKRLHPVEEEAGGWTAGVFPRRRKDRTCLQSPEYGGTVVPEFFPFRGPRSADNFVEFINSHCNTLRTPDGTLTVTGLHRQYLLQNLFSVGDLPNSITVSEALKARHDNANGDHFCQREDGVHCTEQPSGPTRKLLANAPACERIAAPSNKEDFLNNYLFRSKPVIITNAMTDWPAMSKWTNDFFLQHYGKEEVHIKLTPKGEFEGIEDAEIWETYNSFKIPLKVLKQLPYPDLVVVRPAGINMNFSEFLNLVHNVSEGTVNNVSAYLEYTSIKDSFPELKDDVFEMPFFRNVLKQAHLNIWLSDGNTLGKAHFDPFDNFLCQISGEKEVTMFEPHNDFLYEAHIPEAILSYNATLRKFRRSKLLESTSMVMTPVDISKPHIERFPRFGSARPLSCTIGEGDVLYMPAFWWHEVQSRPSPTLHRNLAVNFWYEPFFEKEFPCPECRLDINPKYRNLL